METKIIDSKTGPLTVEKYSTFEVLTSTDISKIGGDRFSISVMRHFEPSDGVEFTDAELDLIPDRYEVVFVDREHIKKLFKHLKSVLKK